MVARLLTICLLVSIPLAPSVRAEEDRATPSDNPFPPVARRELKPKASRFRARLRTLESAGGRLEATTTFLNDHPRHTRAMVAYGSLLYDQHSKTRGCNGGEAIAIDPREATPTTVSQ